MGVRAKGALAGVAVIVALLVGSLVIVYTVLSSRVDALSQDVRTARAELDSARVELEQTGSQGISQLREQVEDNAELITNKLEENRTSVLKRMDRADRRIKTLLDCLPEVQAQINGLFADTSSYQGYVTNVYISNNQRVSRVCEPVLYTQSAAGGDGEGG